MYLAPHHILLALLENHDIKGICEEQGIDLKALAEAIKKLRNPAMKKHPLVQKFPLLNR